MSLPDPARSRVVLIGASHFADPALPDLPAVRNNLDALAACLRGLGECTVVADPESPIVLVDPIHDAAAAAEDTLLIYYAGHGLVHPRTLGLLLAVAGSVPARTHTAVPYDLVRENVIDSPARRKIVILDCCYSGRALGGMSDPTTTVADEATVEGTVLLASAPPNKQALSPPGEQFTAFTGALVGVLRDGVPDGPELLHLDFIYRHVRDTLRRAARPEPQLRAANTAGDLALLRNPWYQTVSEPRPKVRDRIKELVRGSGLETPYDCPVCGITVSGPNLVRHVDKHSPAEMARLNPATLTLTPRPVVLDGRYQLGRPLRGSADLIRATDTKTWRPVTVRHLANVDVDDRLRHLDDRGIVRVLDIRPGYTVLEAVEGMTAADLLRATGPLEPDQAVRMTIGICDALDYLHGEGLCHGNLKSGNVIRQDDGTVKLLILALGSRGVGPDLYAAGRLLLELLTGMQPALHILTSFLGSSEADIPPHLEPIVRTALDDGYASAADLKHALQLA